MSLQLGRLSRGTSAEPRTISELFATPQFLGTTESWDSSEKETNARLRSKDLNPRGRLARALAVFFFMSIVFLTGAFIGASLIADVPTRPWLSAPTLSPRPAPTPESSASGGSSREPAGSQAVPADTTPTEAAPAPPSSVAALPEDVPAVLDRVSAPAPVLERPAAMAVAPPVSAEPISDAQRQALLSRGDSFFSAGDLTSARLFYQRAADAGDGTAALRLGETFDAAFLGRAHFGRVPSDVAKAVFWYRQARDLGNAEAEILLKSLPAN
jgi:Sel1 repeat